MMQMCFNVLIGVCGIILATTALVCLINNLVEESRVFSSQSYIGRMLSAFRAERRERKQRALMRLLDEVYAQKRDIEKVDDKYKMFAAKMGYRYDVSGPFAYFENPTWRKIKKKGKEK